jgi:hypothetical protein
MMHVVAHSVHVIVRACMHVRVGEIVLLLTLVVSARVC